MQPQSLPHNLSAAICAPKDISKTSRLPGVTSFTEINTLEKYLWREALTSSGEFDEEIQQPPTASSVFVIR
jgi:hypothetical protein